MNIYTHYTDRYPNMTTAYIGYHFAPSTVLVNTVDNIQCMAISESKKLERLDNLLCTLTNNIIDLNQYVLSLSECPTVLTVPNVNVGTTPTPPIKNNVTDFDLFTLYPVSVSTSELFDLRTDSDPWLTNAGLVCPMLKYTEDWVHVFNVFRPCKRFLLFARWIINALTESALFVVSPTNTSSGPDKLYKYATTLTNYRHLVHREIDQWLFDKVVRLIIPGYNVPSDDERPGRKFMGVFINISCGPKLVANLPTMRQILHINPNFSLRNILATPEFALERMLLEECISREYDFCSHYDINRIIAVPSCDPVLVELTTNSENIEDLKRMINECVVQIENLTKYVAKK